MFIFPDLFPLWSLQDSGFSVKSVVDHELYRVLFVILVDTRIPDRNIILVSFSYFYS